MKNAFNNPRHVSHTISSSKTLHNMPRNTNSRQASTSKPADLRGLSGRCASCGKGRGR